MFQRSHMIYVRMTYPSKKKKLQHLKKILEFSIMQTPLPLEEWENKVQAGSSSLSAKA